MKCSAMIVAALLIAISTSLGAEWDVFVNSNNVTSLWHDSSHIWWGGSYGGVVSYDPDTEFFQKIVKAVGELRSNQVTAVALDEAGAVWIGTASDGICIDDGGTWRFENTQSLHLLGDNVLDIYARGQKVAVGTSGGLSLFDAGAFTRFFNGNDWAHSGCDSVLAVALNQTEVLVGTTCGAFSYTFEAETWREILARRRTRRIAYDGDSLFWMVGGDSIYAYNGSSTNTVSTRLIEGELVRDIGANGSKVWVVTNYGPSRYRQVLRTWMHNRNGISDDLIDVHRIRVADDGTPWIGTKDGVGFLPDTTWMMVKSPGPASNYVEDLCLDGTHKLVVTTGYRKAGPPPGADRGLLRYDPATLKWEQFLAPDLPSNRAYTCETSPVDGMVWLGFWGDNTIGLVKFDPVTSVFTKYRDGLNSGTISDIYIDPRGNIAFGEYLWGMGVRSQAGQVVQYSKADPGTCISSICITAVGPGPNGSYFLGNYFVSAEEGCNAELVKLGLGGSFLDKSDDSCEQWSSLAGWPQGIATYAFALDPFGVEWMGSDGGLGAYDFTCHDPSQTSWHRTNVRLGAVWDVKVDSLGNKWVASDQGLYILRGFGLEWDDFSEIDVFNSTNSPLEDVPVKAIQFAADGAVWLGTAGGGIYRYEPPRVQLKPKAWVDAYPNPYLAFRDQCGKGIAFSGALAGSKISIYTVAGELVGEIDSGGTWNTKNGRGDDVVSGVYLYVGRAEDGKDFKGRLVIVR